MHMSEFSGRLAPPCFANLSHNVNSMVSDHVNKRFAVISYLAQLFYGQSLGPTCHHLPDWHNSDGFLNFGQCGTFASSINLLTSNFNFQQLDLHWTVLMASNVISLPVASSSEHLQALAEVSNFGLTDMGYPGQGPWAYRILKEPSLMEELSRMSGAKTYGFGVDIVSLQPCPSHISQSQDRCVVEEWNLPGGKWIFNGVFDGQSCVSIFSSHPRLNNAPIGHLNHHTVDFVVGKLPNEIKEAIHTAISSKLFIHPSKISEILRSSIQRIDTSLITQFLDLLPRNPNALNRLEDSDIQQTFHRGEGDNLTYDIAVRSLGGTTLVLSLADPRGNLWVASLGGMDTCVLLLI